MLTMHTGHIFSVPNITSFTIDSLAVISGRSQECLGKNAVSRSTLVVHRQILLRGGFIKENEKEKENTSGYVIGGSLTNPPRKLTTKIAKRAPYAIPLHLPGGFSAKTNENETPLPKKIPLGVLDKFY